MADDQAEVLKLGLQDWMKAYLKDNLSIRINCRDQWDYYSNGIAVDVELSFGEEVIADSSTTFSFPSQS